MSVEYYDFMVCPDCNMVIEEIPCEYCGYGEEESDEEIEIAVAEAVDNFDPTPDWNKKNDPPFAENY